MRVWAFWRRVQYGVGFCLFWLGIFTYIYLVYFAVAPTCFDNSRNGSETGVDCGGDCVRICAFEVVSPTVAWARSFPGNSGLYNAVAYIENKNRIAATPEIRYTISLYDAGGLITERSGVTLLPPDSAYPIFEDRIDTFGRVPTQTFVELEPATMWVPAPNATKQFTVTNRQLSGVDLKPRLDASIYNNGIDEAEEIEVVATIFDKDGNALTASRTFVDDLIGKSEQAIVFTWPEPIAKTLKSCEVPTDVVLGIDLSGSMNNDGDNPPQPITSVLQAAQAFVQRLQPDDQVGIVTFATEAVITTRLTTDKAAVADIVSGLVIEPREEVGSTNTGGAFLQAGAELTSTRHNNEARKVLVLLTDGLATAPDESPEEYALAQAELIKSLDVEVYTIGLGEQVNMEFVTAVASTPSHAYRAVSTTEVNRIYETITSSLCEQGPSIIQIVPKSDALFTPLR